MVKMQNDFKDLLIEDEVLNAINLAKAIDSFGPKAGCESINFNNNISIVAATAFRKIYGLITFLKEVIGGEHDKLIESEKM